MFSKKLLTDRQFLIEGLQQPYLVIENALLPDFAEQLYNDLMESTAWQSSDLGSFSPKEKAQIYEGYSFSREIIKLESKRLPENVKNLFSYLKSKECLQWISEVSGRRCDNFSGACARYYGNNHLTSHNDYYLSKTADNGISSRTITFNYYLTKNWEPAWGGNFVWEKPYAKLSPIFNTLVMFPVGHDSMHHVEKINHTATVPRLAFTGWFTTTRNIDDNQLKLSNP